MYRVTLRCSSSRSRVSLATVVSAARSSEASLSSHVARASTPRRPTPRGSSVPTRTSTATTRCVPPRRPRRARRTRKAPARRETRDATRDPTRHRRDASFALADAHSRGAQCPPPRGPSARPRDAARVRGAFRRFGTVVVLAHNGYLLFTMNSLMTAVVARPLLDRLSDRSRSSHRARIERRGPQVPVRRRQPLLRPLAHRLDFVFHLVAAEEHQDVTRRRDCDAAVASPVAALTARRPIPPVRAVGIIHSRDSPRIRGAAVVAVRREPAPSGAYTDNMAFVAYASDGQLARGIDDAR